MSISRLCDVWKSSGVRGSEGLEEWEDRRLVSRNGLEGPIWRLLQLYASGGCWGECARHVTGPAEIVASGLRESRFAVLQAGTWTNVTEPENSGQRP
jgi:hypothetical protein